MWEFDCPKLFIDLQFEINNFTPFESNPQPDLWFLVYHDNHKFFDHHESNVPETVDANIEPENFSSNELIGEISMKTSKDRNVPTTNKKLKPSKASLSSNTKTTSKQKSSEFEFNKVVGKSQANV